MGPDVPAAQLVSSVIEVPDEVYDRIPSHRKLIIVALLSFCSFLAPMSSTSVLAATPEVAKTYDTTGSIINIANALYMLFMGLSPIIWGPLSQVYGRRPVGGGFTCIPPQTCTAPLTLLSQITLVTSVAFFACSIGTALAPNLAAFFVFRILTAFEGTSFILIGSAVIA
jgi:MFS family permease